MKKVITLAFAILVLFAICSCGGGGGANNSQNNAPMQYTVCFSNDFCFPVKGVTVYECAENGDKIYENKFMSATGKRDTFTAQPQAKKVKLYLSVTDPMDPFGPGTNGWLPLVYYLTPNEPKVIRIDNHVSLSRFEP